MKYTYLFMSVILSWVLGSIESWLPQFYISKVSHDLFQSEIEILSLASEMHVALRISSMAEVVD